MTKSRGIRPPRKPWTDEQQDMVRRLYADTRNSELAELTGHTEAALYRMAHKLGVKKSPEYLRLMGGYLDGVRGTQSRFASGHVPWIKGKSLPGRTSSTSFKPGQRPANWMPLGAHRVNAEGMLERKIREGNNGGLNWEAVHRLVWKAAHGPVPKRHVITFKPGMKTNVLEQITADKLECISFADNARRNSMWLNTPELAPLYNLKGQIARQVNKITKEQTHDDHATPH